MSESTSHDVRSLVVRVILVGAVLLEALVCVGYGVYLGIDAAAGHAAEPAAAAVQSVSAVLVGVALLIAARAAWRRRRAARAPILVWQLMQLSVASLTRGTDWLPVGVALALLAVSALVTALWPGVLDVEGRS